MSKETVSEAIVGLLRESGLSFDDQVKAIAMARVAIQPRASDGDWRGKAKMIERPSGGIMAKGKHLNPTKGEKEG